MKQLFSRPSTSEEMADSANPDDYFLPLILKNNFFDIKDVVSPFFN